MAPEQLVGVVLLAVILLINLVGRLLGRTEEDVEAPDAPDAPPESRLIPSQAAPRPSGPVAPRRQDKQPETGKQPERAGAPVVVPRPKLRDRLKHRHTLRSAVVFMTVLGACRGLELSDPPR